METLSQLLADSEQVRDEVATNANTASRVGTLFKNICESFVHKSYFASFNIVLEVNVPDDTIKTLYSVDFTALPDQSVEFGGAGSEATGFVDFIVTEAGDGDGSGDGEKRSMHVRRHVKRFHGGDVEFIGPPIVISEHNFTHTLTFTDGNPGLFRLTKDGDYDSTLQVRVNGELQTRTFGDP